MKKEILIALFLLPFLAYSQSPLNIDPSFGVNGVAAFNFFDDWDKCTGSHRYADNRILLVGYTQDGNGARRVLALARMLPNGRPDPNFGVQGKTTLDYTGLSNTGVVKVVDPVVLSDGSIIIPMTYNTGNNVRRVIAKLRPNGQLETAFGENGFYVDSRLVQDIYGCMVESDNKILCLGQDVVTITDGLLRGRTSFFKLMPDGKIDTSFNGNNPIIYTLYPGTNFTEAPFEMIPNGNDGFFAAGIAAPPGGESGIFLLKVKSDGKIDSTYGNNGFSLNPGAQMPYPLWSPTRMKRARNGGFLMTGLARSTGSSAPFETAVYRFSPQGLLDRSFGENGVAVMKYPPSTTNNLTSQDVLEDDQNRLWVAHAGKVPDFSYITYSVSRFLANGDIDSSYGGSGHVITGMPIGPKRIYLDSDGLPILTGTSGLSNFTDEDDFLAVRVKPAELSVKPKVLTNLQLAPNVVAIGTPLQIKLPHPGSYQISCLSLNGQSKSFKGKGNEFILNTSDLQSGMYLILVNQQGQQFQGKVWVK